MPSSSCPDVPFSPIDGINRSPNLPCTVAGSEVISNGVW
jgi:hypothetical protein